MSEKTDTQTKMFYVHVRENVARAIDFEGPERVPVEHFGFHLKNIFELSDIVEVSSNPASGWTPSKPGETEWGFVFDTAEGRAWGMGAAREPPLTSWDKLDTFQFPDPYDKSRYESKKYSAALNTTLPSAKSLIEHFRKTKYVQGGLGLTGFTLMQCLRGDSTIMVDMYRNQDRVEELIEKLLENTIGLIEMFHTYGANGVICYDDWATQEGLFLPPELFRQFLFPMYEELIQTAHRHGMHFLHHCCGYVYDIIGDLIEIGLDGIQLDQPEVAGGGGSSGVDRLGKAYGGKICFVAGVDIQGTLVRGSLTDIEREARHLIEAFGSFDGGFIGRPYAEPTSIALTSDSPQFETMYRTFREYGKYPRREI